MILLLMINKEVKQFFRYKGNVIMLFIFPLVLITCLVFALKGVMGGELNIFKDTKVLYKVEEKSKYYHGFEIFKNKFNKISSVEFKEVGNTDQAKALVDERQAIGYISINEEGYNFYRRKSGETTAGKIFRGVFEQTLANYSLVDTILEEDPTRLQEVLKEESNKYVSEGSIGGKGITSFEYYTFAELALIILYISITIAYSVYEENKLTTINRIRISKSNDFQLIFSKGIVGIIIAILQIVEVYIFSTFILNVEWGDKLPIMVLVLISLSIFSSVIGIIVGLLARDSKNINGILNSSIIVICMLGGCYAPLSMIKSIPILSSLVKVSPVYWANTALISLNTGVDNNSGLTSILVSLILSLVLVLSYFFIRKIKGGKIIA
ncbi:MAG: ABC transporter permease [Clostridium septicum]|uniref:ABC transporter permease n=1 Tax=Clostridium septicum TaxID=1504 RepID=UPI00258355A9|nr:ABC transporter permease [Clostridium septicum]MDU1312873.1 ABC transporter permease [Clostridium septicum]